MFEQATFVLRLSVSPHRSAQLDTELNHVVMNLIIKFILLEKKETMLSLNFCTYLAASQL